MTSSTMPALIVDRVATTLVATQMFPTKEAALWDLAFSAVQKKIRHYQRRIRRLEQKYGTTLEDFTLQLKNQATPEQEDDWLAWRSAQSMMEDWRQTYQDLLHEHAR
ncbi:MAG: hypothetical protein R3C14_04445 [Caldilineaceae bacterium]